MQACGSAALCRDSFCLCAPVPHLRLHQAGLRHRRRRVSSIPAPQARRQEVNASPTPPPPTQPRPCCRRGALRPRQLGPARALQYSSRTAAVGQGRPSSPCGGGLRRRPSRCGATAGPPDSDGAAWRRAGPAGAGYLPGRGAALRVRAGRPVSGWLSESSILPGRDPGGLGGLREHGFYTGPRKVMGARRRLG
jgi:hypothetical protein